MSIDPQTIEEDLRTAMHAGSSAIAAWPDPVARVEAGVTRRRRRTLLVTSAAAVLTAGVAFAGVGIAGHREPPPNSIVSAEPAAAPTIARRSPRAAVQPCRLDRVDEVDWIVQSAPWGLSTGFAVRPNESERCTMTGRPVLSGVNTATGRSEPVTVVNLGPLEDDVTRQFPATVDPGEPARVKIRSSTTCPAGQKPKSYRDLVLTFGEKKLPLSGSNKLTGVCGADVSQWYVEPPMDYASLNATVKAPAVLRAGEEFSYTVTIDNVFPDKYKSGSCPVFRLSVAADGTGPWQRINCEETTIGGRGSVEFTLPGTIPADVEPGRHKLTWMAAMGNGEAVIADMGTDGTAVTVTR
ncbi:hypothetical protein KOI35_40910 [Actinoplanes bogorensis]|uniref:DUF4232 domain-containing protein n=1 Tax=Paractinoplanes bogorensis TaxID=1610840 RepID=A0ABS5Z3F8_9ACTN|nr:hypothetical protein [Actinoplanes bogorensis]MBU2669891.1 hypothetical protein [Actinoplanes bogorensis]